MWRNSGKDVRRFSPFNFQGKWPQEILHKFLHTSGPPIPHGLNQNFFTAILWELGVQSFWKKARKTTQKTKISVLAETLKYLGRRENAPKKGILEKRKSVEIKSNKEKKIRANTPGMQRYVRKWSKEGLGGWGKLVVLTSWTYSSLFKTVMALFSKICLHRPEVGDI